MMATGQHQRIPSQTASPKISPQASRLYAPDRVGQSSSHAERLPETDLYHDPYSRPLQYSPEQERWTEASMGRHASRYGPNLDNPFYCQAAPRLSSDPSFDWRYEPARNFQTGTARFQPPMSSGNIETDYQYRQSGMPQPRAREVAESLYAYKEMSTEIEEEDEPVPTMYQSIRNIKIRSLLRPKYFIYYAIILLILVATALITIYHDKIITFLRPISKSIRNLTAGWVIPVAVLFIISFPPLFGHEIVAILCGVVYGLWIGFGIVCAGTFLGEIGNFYAFRYWFKDRMRKYETKSLNYSCLAYIIRHGGFTVVIMARLSAIPGHFTTAIFASVGMSIWIFALAAFLTLPKQLAIVYLGALLNKEGPADGGDPNSTVDPASSAQADHVKTVVTDSVLAVSFVITIGAAIFLYMKMRKVRVLVARERRKAAKIAAMVEAEALSSQQSPDTDQDHLVDKEAQFDPEACGRPVTPTPLTPRDRSRNHGPLSRDRHEIYPRVEDYPHLLHSQDHLPTPSPTYPPPDYGRSPMAPAATATGTSPRDLTRTRGTDSPGSRSSRRDLIRLPSPHPSPSSGTRSPVPNPTSRFI